MYYIMLEDGRMAYARVTESFDEEADADRPFWIGRYEYDDETIWTKEKLELEKTRVSSGSGYDPKAMVAIDIEHGRRKGREVPTFETIEEMLEYWEENERGEAKCQGVNFH